MLWLFRALAKRSAEKILADFTGRGEVASFQQIKSLENKAREVLRAP